MTTPPTIAWAPCSIRDLREGDIILHAGRESRVINIERSDQDVHLVLKARYRRVELTTRENDVVKRRVFLDYKEV